MKTRCVSIVKPEPNTINEDAVLARNGCIAVADGAGGGGMFAERWSRYLLDHLPPTPITTFEQLDQWIDGIWEPYYNDCEKMAKAMGGMVQKKFYDEGSFSTLAAMWHCDDKVLWTTYGDSVAFCYDRKTGNLQFSISSLAKFNTPPYLISCKDPLHEEGFAQGEYEYSSQNIYFVTSDALAHYIIMMYMLSKKEQFQAQLDEAVNAHSKNSTYIKSAMMMSRIDFDKVLKKLLNCVGHKWNFSKHIAAKRRQYLIAIDDYSIASMFCPLATTTGAGEGAFSIWSSSKML